MPPGDDRKVSMCHVTSSASNPVVLISIDVAAVPAHLAIGDFFPVGEDCNGEE